MERYVTPYGACRVGGERWATYDAAVLRWLRFYFMPTNTLVYSLLSSPLPYQTGRHLGLHRTVVWVADISDGNKKKKENFRLLSNSI